PRRPPVHGALGAGTWRTGNCGSQARLRRVELRKGSRLLRATDRLHSKSRAGSRSSDSNRSGLLYRLHGWTLADTTTAVAIHPEDRHPRLIARFPRSPAVIRLHATGYRRS